MYFENFEKRTIFEYDITDFCEDELNLIRIFCKKFLKNLKYLNQIPTSIPPPPKFEIDHRIKNGIKKLEDKGLYSKNGLRLKTYIYYELIIDNNLNNIILLCKLLHFFEEYRKRHNWDEIILNESLLNEIPIGLKYRKKFLINLLKDLELIDVRLDLLTSDRIFMEITKKGDEIMTDFCQFWNLKNIVRYINEVKENYLNETYENLRVRIVAFNHNGIKKLPETFPYSEILYFRIDYTQKECGQKEPLFSYNEEIGLFDEIIHFEDLERRMEISPIMEYHFDEYILEFAYPFPNYFYYNNFIKKLKSGYEWSRISCKENGDLINIIFFDHFKHFPGIEFSLRELEGIEFLEDDGSFSNVTEKVNTFIGYNLSALDQPSFAIVLPINSFKLLDPIFEENDEIKSIEMKWSADQSYHSLFRCKMTINGKNILIPPEGKKIEIKSFHQREFPLVFQWSGDIGLFPNNYMLAEYGNIKNKYYRPIKVGNQHNLIENQNLIRKQINTGYTIMDDFLIQKLENEFKNLKLPQKFQNDFLRVLNYFGNKLVYNNNHKDFLQDYVEEWYEKNKELSRKEMETKCFHPKMREHLKSEFGEEIIDTPDEARGHIDLKLSFTIPIELKVLKDKKGRKKEDNRNALDLLENQYVTQIKSEIINSYVGFLVGLDFRKKINRDLTIMPHPEYMRFKWIKYPQSRGLIIFIVFLANKKTSSS